MGLAKLVATSRALLGVRSDSFQAEQKIGRIIAFNHWTENRLGSDQSLRK
jgi:hypothetical protein